MDAWQGIHQMCKVQVAVLGNAVVNWQFFSCKKPVITMMINLYTSIKPVRVVGARHACEMCVQSVGAFFVLLLFFLMPLFSPSGQALGANKGAPGNQAVMLDETVVFAGKQYARIVGGQVATNPYPWMLSLQYKDGSGQYQHLCGAVAIAPNAALTASHCLQRLPLANLRVSWRADNLRPHAALDAHRAVVQVVRHPYFNSVTLDHDIAILRWANPIGGLEPLALALPAQLIGGASGQWARLDWTDLKAVSHPLASYSGQQLLPGVYAAGLPLDVPLSQFRVLGWGATDPENLTTLSDQLREATLQVFPQNYCDSRAISRAQTSLCAGVPSATVDSCVGDSGGPLLRVETSQSVNPLTGQLQQHESYLLVGLVSYGAGCAVPDQPGFYTDVMQLLPFIQGVILGRDHWVPVGWLGQGLVYRQDFTLFNFGNDPWQLGSMNRSDPQGLQIEGAGCELAFLGRGESCELSYQYVTQSAGRFLTSSPFNYAVNLADGTVDERTGFLLGVGNTLSPLVVDNAFSGVGQRWFSGADRAWRADNSAFVAGGISLRSGPITDNQTSVLQGFFEGPSSSTVYVFVESETGYDELVLTVNGEVRFVGSGMTQWEPVVLDIPPEGAVVEFTYYKDSSVSAQRDAAWIDFESLDDAGRSLESIGFVTHGSKPSDTVPAAPPGDGGAGGGVTVVQIAGLLGVLFMRLSRLGGLSMGRLGRWPLLSMMLLSLTACGSTQTSQTRPPAMAPKPPVVKEQLNSEPASKQEFLPTAEPLYSKQYKNGQLYIQVRSFGCTSGSSFRLVASQERAGWYTIERVKPDFCRRAPMLMTAVVPVSQAIAEQLVTSGHGQKIPLTNITVPKTGLPEIPFD